MNSLYCKKNWATTGRRRDIEIIQTNNLNKTFWFSYIGISLEANFASEFIYLSNCFHQPIIDSSKRNDFRFPIKARKSDFSSLLVRFLNLDLSFLGFFKRQIWHTTQHAGHANNFFFFWSQTILIYVH